MTSYLLRHIILFVLLAFHLDMLKRFYLHFYEIYSLLIQLSWYQHGFKSRVNYSRFDYGDGTSYIDNKYLHGNFAFDDMNFSIGLDVNSFSLTNLGLTENQIDLSYIYKIPVNFDTYILGALYLGIL